ncbi:MAG: translocation/assembly module TamB domain-containing protein, partial [Salegentibacter sp.]
NKSLGKLNLSLSAKGQGTDVNSLDATMEANISSFQYNKYEIKDLKISGDLEDGAGNITSNYKDANINANLDAYVELDSVKPAVNLNLNLKGANLQALGITSRDIRIALDLNADYKGNADSYDVNASIRDGVAVYNNQSYLLGALDATAYVRPDSTSVDVNNRILDLDLQSNASPADFSAALQRHYNSYFNNNPKTDTVKNPVNLELKATIAQTPILNEVFFSNLEKMDTVHLNVDFNEKNRSLVADVNVPFVRYYSSEVDSLAIALNSDKKSMKFDLGFNSLDAGPLAIKKTSVSGNIANQKMDVDLLSTYKDEKILHIQSEIAKSGDTIDLHIVPSGLILNGKEWTMPQDNRLLIAHNLREFQNFRMTRNDQNMEITNNKPAAPKKNIAISFNGFDLAGFLSFLNPEEKLATGNLNGNLIIEDPFGETGLLADLQIHQFNMMEVDLGTLSLNGKSLGNRTYKFDMGVKGGQVDLDLTGNYKAQQPAAALDLNLNLNNVEMTAMEGFTQGAIKAGSGSFSGNIKLSGTTAKPEYNGSLHFDDAGFTIATLSAGFLLPNENLKLDNKGLYFDNFTIQDDHENDLVIDGSVYTESLLNPSFDLKVNASNFEVLNSTKEENDLYYGKASVDIDATLTGDLNLPKLDAKLEVGSNTNVTYVVPKSDVAMQKREGIVMFVNKENPDAILTQTEEKPETFTGYDINALISLDKDASFTLVIDPETGDNFQVEGQGDLRLNVYPNGRTTLTGRYTMSGGHYEMSLYGLVKRRFEIADESTVTWMGDPFNASLDVRAIYKVETSAYSLMAPQIAGSDESLANQYRRELPFWVYLNIDGELMHPKISFGLDMPKDEQGYAGGQVYGRVQQLDQQEQELNKQVFSLLVLNRFYPEPGSNGSQGGTMSIARDNLNEALSDQLNMFSDRLLGDTGVKLNFGVDSFTDYQGESAQQRTQLDITAQKKLFDDRLIMSVGSQVDVQGSNRNPDEQTPVIGNVSLEYLLTKDGRFRLKGFQRNEFENVIDGQLIVSGIALIFTKEFNEFRNLWKSIINSQSKQNSEESK